MSEVVYLNRNLRNGVKEAVSVSAIPFEEDEEKYLRACLRQAVSGVLEFARRSDEHRNWAITIAEELEYRAQFDG